MLGRVIRRLLGCCLVLATLPTGGAERTEGGPPALPFPLMVETLIEGLDQPTVVRFAPDGRIFVAEKKGRVVVFDDSADTEPEVLLDLTRDVSSYRDRGLLGMALDPDFSRQPFLYLLYTYDAPPGGTAPVWNDACPNPPGGDVDGCVVSARLARFDLRGDDDKGGDDKGDDGKNGKALAGTALVLLEEGWCQQFPGHSIGTAIFGPDGALYVGAGDGANFRPGNGDFGGVDFGQLGGRLVGTPTPANPCGDPPVPVGGLQTPPDAEGGALRSQDLRTTGDPLGHDGALLRLDPATGEAPPDNPLVGGAPGDDRIVAFGLRNPFRFTVHPETGEIWIGDVGWNGWEEIDRIVDPTDEQVENFGWPCFEGPDPQPDYQAVGLDLCTSLYDGSEPVEPPFYAYAHGSSPVPDRCNPLGATAISGLAFYVGDRYPARYHGALVFADSLQGCLWAMLPDESGLPDPARILTLVERAGAPVDLVGGPEDDLVYVDYLAGAIRRIVPDPSALFGDDFESGDTSAWSR